ncbi:MAG: signal peptidase I [Oscillospiraceae bacterium]|nr:signal peptidase I [Oscillospiraceae bacterium]
MSVLQQQFMQLIDACGDIDDSDGELLALLGVPAQSSDDEPSDLPAASATTRLKPRSKALPWVALALMAVLCVVILGGAAMTALSADHSRAVAGLRVFHVTSNSMAPSSNGEAQPGWMRQGDAVIVRAIAPERINVGDVVAIDRGAQQPVLTHRVMAVLENFSDPSGLGFITQGDANRNPDPHAGGSQVLGVTALRIPFVGHALNAVHENLAVSVVLGALGLLGGVALIVRLFYRGKGEKNTTDNRCRDNAPALSGV